MMARRAAAAALLLWGTCEAWGGGVEPPALTDDHVLAAIAAIADAIAAQRDPRGFWEPPATPQGESRQIHGYTALAVLALLSAGRSYQHPDLREAVAHLESAPMDGTYARAVRAILWGALPPRFQDRLEADTQWLLAGFSDRAGGWDYRQQPATTRRDNSITQFGALALWEAAKRGVRVDDRYWEALEQRFLSMQLADGGWNYKGDGPATGSMTAAGLATLFITQDFLHAREYESLRGAPRDPARDAIERGLEWMSRNFSPTENPGRDEWFLYYLYAVERVGLASGRKRFGPHDWFRAGAAEAIRRVCEWDAATGTMTVRRTMAGAGSGQTVRLRHLAFALLFLSRGRVPVAINKLQVPGLAWNNRPHDVANLTRFLSESTEAALSWQVVPLDADPAEWLDAPLLYLASDEAVRWEPGGEELLRLRAFLDRGGLLLCVGEGPRPDLTQSIELAGSSMYPGYQWRTLPEDHPLHTMLWPPSGRPPALRALSNGVRELIVVVPGGDLPGALQVRGSDRRAAWQAAAHAYLYASEMNSPSPRLGSRPYRGSTVRVARDALVVRARHEGNWNPEPMALDLAAASLAQDPARIRLADADLASIGHLDPPPDLVVACGTEAQRLTPAERSAIERYVRGGGVVLFESPGGGGRFTRSAEEACLEIFGAAAGGALPLLRSRLITGAGLPGAADLSRVEYRPYAHLAFGARETSPRLRGIVLDGQPRVIFSREDLTHALLDRPCWGVAGYTPRFARDLLGNVILHAQALREESAR
jgi:hypothetical protein